MVSQEWSEELKSKKTDILFVAFGSPKQEIWIAENLNQLPAKVVIGVGGAFDFISGKVRRAPVFIRQLGLEWLFRLIIQPWRIKRQLKLLTFIDLVLKEKFSAK
jgi:N-acetylglucosaminyldiphosphoundecaprenol N-acetyl-beta-D-mannosaminyltransferase